MSTELRERFDRAAAAEPLCALDPAAASELRSLLDGTVDFEDLPGRWQAALLQAESGADGPAPGGCCCGR